jgi:hypothetical protein
MTSKRRRGAGGRADWYEFKQQGRKHYDKRRSALINRLMCQLNLKRVTCPPFRMA